MGARCRLGSVRTLRLGFVSASKVCTIFGTLKKRGPTPLCVQKELVGVQKLSFGACPCPPHGDGSIPSRVHTALGVCSCTLLPMLLLLPMLRCIAVPHVHTTMPSNVSFACACVPDCCRGCFADGVVLCCFAALLLTLSQPPRRPPRPPAPTRVNDDCQCSKPTKDIRANRVLPFWNEQCNSCARPPC